ncbi:transposase [Azospirillum largimobile]
MLSGWREPFRRGRSAVWFRLQAVARWQAEMRTTPGGQRLYSDPAITTALTLRAVLRLPLRRTEGLDGSIVRLVGVELAVLDHSTLSRRAQTLCLPSEPVSSGGAVELLVGSTEAMPALGQCSAAGWVSTPSCCGRPTRRLSP